MENTQNITFDQDDDRHSQSSVFPLLYSEFPNHRPESKGEADSAARHGTFLYLSALLWLRTTTNVRKIN